MCPKVEEDYNISKELEKLDKLTNNIDKNLERLKKEFHAPMNEDIVFRNVVTNDNRRCTIVYINVMVNDDMIQRHIIEPLQDLKGEHDNDIFKKVISAKDTKELDSFDKIVDSITMGMSILLVEDYSTAISVETIKFDHRGVEKPVSENVIKGPQEAFIESSKTNLSLIRKRLRSKNLVTESITIGEQSKSKVTILYLKNIVDDKLVENIKERISKLKVDTIQNIPILEQHIEERPYSLVPSILYTERPDRAVSFIHEGHVVLLMDSSSECLVLPITFWSLFHTSEDTYLRWINGNFIRLIRLLAFFIALLTPGLFVAVITHHVDMIPTDLILAISATRERVPFPLIIEVFLMEVAFEILRESGIRIPTPIGPTIGIVGALILGQAAVQANLVSPILVIVVAITGLSSFAIGNISLNFIVRISKFLLLIAGGVLGITGVTAGLMMLIAYLVSVKSFGVPFLSPLTPHYSSSKDMIVRPPLWKQWIRPQYTNPKQKARKKVERKE